MTSQLGMAIPPLSATFAMCTTHVNGALDGAWWPRSRRLQDELGELLDVWPKSAGTIVRVLYSQLDWDDRPTAVVTHSRRLATGSFPHDVSHEIVVTVLGGGRRTLTVIPPQATAADASRILADVHGPAAIEPDLKNIG